METPGPADSSYAFGNDAPEAADRHVQLAALLDEFTISRLSALGDLTGRRCLETGAGGGSVAAWLAEAAGPAGRVLATDVDTQHLPAPAPYEVLRHDLEREPVPDGPWDVIHARLVLMHLPSREAVLRRLAAALAPGGALVVEDFETTFRKLVLAAPTMHAAALVDRYHVLLVERVLAAHGNDPAWAGRVPAAMLEAGLTGIDTVIHARSWPGGTAGALLIGANLAQARAGFLAAGMTRAELDELGRLVHDPRLLVRGHLTYSTIGRAPTPCDAC
ncbi:class I SAM-dependent methyltransferase [Streptomyces sp. NPDC059785]|uniref:class I SAM-dependent methyltransferase n=1 Tax=Streptomyces sp. NPDC059785 TaxID=3346945 RepID=UPI0036469019